MPHHENRYEPETTFSRYLSFSGMQPTATERAGEQTGLNFIKLFFQIIGVHETY
jgi:hypothetical protein